MKYLFPSLGLLFVLLLILKLTHAIALSWWWVVTPLFAIVTIAVVLIIQWAEGDKP